MTRISNVRVNELISERTADHDISSADVRAIALSAVANQVNVIDVSQALEALADRESITGLSRETIAGICDDIYATRQNQMTLRGLGFNVSIDGVEGPQTRRAILAFQAREGLAQTGVFDAATHVRMHEETVAIQEALVGAGYSLEVDGVFGPRTTRAVRDFIDSTFIVANGRAPREMTPDLRQRIIEMARAFTVE